jgi:hypothetical protein
MILTVFMAMVLNSAFWLTALKVDTKVMNRIIFSYVAKLQLNLYNYVSLILFINRL